MKKIAFFVQHMKCAGVEKSLLALVEQLKKEDLDITIYTAKESGELLSAIPDGIKQEKILVPQKLEKYMTIGGIRYTLHEHMKEKHWGKACISAVNYILGKSDFAELNIDFARIPMLEEHYDIAINYHMHSPFLVRYLSEKVDADKKYTWIHNEFIATGYKIHKLQNYLECCDGFCGVSKAVVKEFLEIFPQYREKTSVFSNIIPVEEIRKKSLESAYEYEDKDRGTTRILTVGRLEEQKGLDLAIATCRNLLDKGYRIQWLVVGEGTKRRELEKLIRQNSLERHFILLGAKINPYPFFRVSDLYVQTSRHEGYGISIAEAKGLGLSIVCTDCAGADELVQNGINGYVVAPKVEEIAEKISSLIDLPGGI